MPRPIPLHFNNMEVVSIEPTTRRVRPDRPWMAATVFALAAGALFRLGQFFSNQSFRADEVALLLNVVGKTTRQLFTAHLEHGQAAPPLFLAAERFVSLTLGRGELAERVIPLLLALAALPLFALLAWRVLSPAAAAIATALLCLCDKHIWFSAEVKQYTGDVLIAIALMILFLQAVRTGRSMSLVALSLFAAAAGWFSHAAILVFASLSAATFFVIMWYSRPRLKCGTAAPGCVPRKAEVFDLRSNTAEGGCATLWALLNIPPAVSFTALYFLSLRHQGADTYLEDWWSDSFVDWSRPLAIPLWLIGRLRNLTSYPISPFEWLGVLLVPLMLLGIVGWWKARRWELLAMCLGPIAVTLFAAAVHKYPFSGSRVNLFLVPGLLLLAGAGVQFALQLSRAWRAGRAAPGLLAAVLLAPLLVGDIRCLFVPRNKGAMREVVTYLKTNRAPSEPVYVARNGIEFAWYWPGAPPPVYLNQSAAADPSGPFWVAFSFNADPHPDRQIRDALAPARNAGHETGRFFQTRGGAAYEFKTQRVHDSFGGQLSAPSPGISGGG